MEDVRRTESTEVSDDLTSYLSGTFGLWTLRMTVPCPSVSTLVSTYKHISNISSNQRMALEIELIALTKLAELSLIFIRRVDHNPWAEDHCSWFLVEIAKNVKHSFFRAICFLFFNIILPQLIKQFYCSQGRWRCLRPRQQPPRVWVEFFNFGHLRCQNWFPRQECHGAILLLPNITPLDISQWGAS